MGKFDKQCESYKIRKLRKITVKDIAKAIKKIQCKHCGSLPSAHLDFNTCNNYEVKND